MSDQNTAVYPDIYLNSQRQHSERAREILKYGIVNPWGTPNQRGIRAWRSEWTLPAGTEKEKEKEIPTGLLILPVSATGQSSSTHYATVAGRNLTVRIFDADRGNQSAHGNFFVQIVCVRTRPGEPEEYVDEDVVFPQLNFLSPQTPSKCISVEKRNMEKHRSSQPSNANTCPLNLAPYWFNDLTFCDFTDTGNFLEGDQIRLHFATFMEFTGEGVQEAYFFDDPEMDVNIP